MDIRKLQNGSDIRGIALEGVEGEKVNLTKNEAKVIAKAFIVWLKDKKQTDDVTIAIGTDSRISGPSLKQGFMEGAKEAGCKIFDCGLASTPAMFMTTVDATRPATAGVMITASHLPFNRNGIKFFTNEGGLDHDDITAILEIAHKNEFEAAAKEGTSDTWNFMDTYVANLVSYIRKGANQGDKPLDGMKIIVDAGNGDGGFFEKVLKELGANTEGSQFLEPDGNFPNHIPNPENQEAMDSICQAVVDNKADLGIIFDTDVDRSAIVDKNGDPINRNALIALIAAVILQEHPGSTVVTDSVTSDGLATFIKSKGGVHHRFMRGYKNVINEGIRLNKEGEECWLAIETSGHCALRENYFLDDGAFLVAKLLVDAAKLKAEGKELQNLINELKQPAESKELRFNIKEENFKKYGKEVLKDMDKRLAEETGWTKVEPNFEGIRISCNAPDEDGWFLLRMSLHDPVMPLNIESNTFGGVARIEKRIVEMLAKYDKLTK